MASEKKPNKWIALINIPVQMGVIILGFTWLGRWLDEKYPNSNNWYTIGFVMVGLSIALYNVYRQVQELNK